MKHNGASLKKQRGLFIHGPMKFEPKFLKSKGVDL